MNVLIKRKGDSGLQVVTVDDFGDAIRSVFGEKQVETQIASLGGGLYMMYPYTDQRYDYCLSVILKEPDTISGAQYSIVRGPVIWFRADYPKYREFRPKDMRGLTDLDIKAIERALTSEFPNEVTIVDEEDRDAAMVSSQVWGTTYFVVPRLHQAVLN